MCLDPIRGRSKQTWRYLRIAKHSGSVSLLCSKPAPLQGALGSGITITNAGGAGFKAWEVVKVGFCNSFQLLFSFLGQKLLFPGKPGRVCARHPDQEVGHLRASRNTCGDKQRWFTGDCSQIFSQIITFEMNQGQLTTLTGEDIDYSKGEEAKVRYFTNGNTF